MSADEHDWAAAGAGTDDVIEAHAHDIWARCRESYEHPVIEVGDGPLGEWLVRQAHRPDSVYVAVARETFLSSVVAFMARADAEAVDETILAPDQLPRWPAT